MNGKYVATSWHCNINGKTLGLLFPASVPSLEVQMWTPLCLVGLFALHILAIMSDLYSISLPDLNTVLTCARIILYEFCHNGCPYNIRRWESADVS